MTPRGEQVPVLEHFKALLDANDRRYEQRFKDSQTAVDAALNAARTAVDAALSAAKEAVQKAELASTAKFESVNEFRAALGDQQRTLIPRAEAELRYNAIESRIAKMEQARDERVGSSAGTHNQWSWIMGVTGLVGTLLGIGSVIYAVLSKRP